MQLRERERSWALIRIVYSAERGRGVSVYLGSLGKDAEHVPDELRQKLTEDELVQAQRLVDATRARRDVERRERCARSLPSVIDAGVDWYRDPRNALAPNKAALAAETRDAFSRLLAAMVEAGVGRKRVRRKGTSPS
ncbi:hypothetical protein [Derxia lacustris]|uniref:hypothetical protein n=1 Tax=Derxia lacustris TaxID=764842 RepID=UPI000A16FD60|nr:hypothetical protein [Derxia lacustris]